MRRVAAVAVAAAVVLLAPAAAAQGGEGQAGATPLRLAAPVLTIDPDRLFAASALGRRFAAELEAASRELAAENRAIEARLTAEERALTERRASLPPAEFRALAEAFDARVEEIRREQEAKSRALARQREEDRQRFIEAALPVLAAVMAEAGAAVILDRRAVFLSFEEIDVTDLVIERLDAAFPPDAPAPEGAPGPEAAPEPPGAPAPAAAAPPAPQPPAEGGGAP